MDLVEKQEALIADYSIIEDPLERFAAVVDRGKNATPLAEAERIDAQLVPGCTSRVWLVGDLENGVCRFRVDADSPTIKGVAVLLCDLYSGVKPAEVVAAEPACIEGLGIDRQFTPTRLNGLRQIRKRIREIAEGFAAD